MNSSTFNAQLNGVEARIAANYRKSGDDLLCFLHGGGCIKEQFADAWEHPALQNFSLFAIDLPGFGASNTPEIFSYTAEEHAEICVQVLAQLDHAKIHIIGHSISGTIGLLVANKLGDRLGKYINVEGMLVIHDYLNAEPPLHPDDFHDPLLDELRDVMRGVPEEGWQKWVEWTENVDRNAFYKTCASCITASSDGALLTLLDDIADSTAFIYGTNTLVSGSLTLQEMKKRGVQVIPIEGSGHSPMMDQVAVFYEALGDILAK